MSDPTSLSPTAPASSRRTRYAGAVGISLVVVTVLGIGGVTLNALSRQAQQLAQLESAQKNARDRDALLSLQVSLSALVTRTGTLATRLNQLTGEMATLKARPQVASDMAAQVMALRQDEQALSARVAHLQALPSLTDGVKPAEVKPVATLPTVIVRPGVKSTTHVRKAQPSGTHSAPFVLTGTELRGAEVLAAVAPRGFDRLSQVQLVSTGDVFMGWVLVEADPHQAQFRSGHRRLTLKSEQ